MRGRNSPNIPGGKYSACQIIRKRESTEKKGKKREKKGGNGKYVKRGKAKKKIWKNRRETI